MNYMIYILSFIFCFCGFSFCEKVKQNQAEQVSLSGFTEEGDKKWDLSSDTAEIKSLKSINLKRPKGTLYKNGKSNVTLTAEEGVFDKVKSRIKLKNNVIIKEKDGGIFKSDSMVWDSEQSILSTEDNITAVKDNAVLTGKNFQLNKENETVVLNEDVKIKAYEENSTNHPTIITCDGKMEVSYKDNIAEFFDNVVVTDPKATLRANYMKIILNSSKYELEEITCEGNVVIIQGDKKASSAIAIYSAIEGTIILTGEPKIMRGDNLLGAKKIIFYIKEERVVCSPQAQLILFPTKRDKEIFNL